MLQTWRSTTVRLREPDPCRAELRICEKLMSLELRKRLRTKMRLGIISSTTILFFATPAFADSCVFSAAPPFQFKSDAVEWSMEIASGTSCTRGLKLGPTNITDVKLIAPPQSGQVAIKGPSFSYIAKSDFQGQDDFILQISGTMVRMTGVSDIKVNVSVVAK